MCVMFLDVKLEQVRLGFWSNKKGLVYVFGDSTTGRKVRPTLSAVINEQSSCV